MEGPVDKATWKSDELGGLVIGVHARDGVARRGAMASLVAGFRHLYVDSVSVPDPEQRGLVVTAAEIAGLGTPPDPDPHWGDLLVWLHSAGVGVVVFGGLGPLLSANRRFLWEIGEAWARMDRDGGAPTLVFVDEDRDVLDRLGGERSPFVDPLTSVSERDPESAWELRRLEPLGFGAVARHCPAWSADDVLTGHAVFGGLLPHIRAIDPSQRLAVNIVRLVLDPEGPLFSVPLTLLRRLFQNPSRYAAIVRSLAGSAETWRHLREGVAELQGAGPLGPYLKRLEALDVLRMRISLDAPPGSRRRRYALTDAFDRFWWQLVLPLRAPLLSSVISPEAAWRDHVEPKLQTHVARVFPSMCRDYLATYGLGLPGTEAREIGALWGDGYDLPVVGKLASGPIVYGDCHWYERRPTESWLDRIEEQVRNTRYGFGREARLRLLFTREPPQDRLRQKLLRSDWARRVGPGEMVAAARASTVSDV